MKTIGLLGGMSWESTAGYYKAINEGVRDVLGGLHSARIAMVSVDFEEIEHLQRQGDWAKAGKVLSQAAKHIQAAGADFLLICTNTMHKVVTEIELAIDIPVLHIADATAEVLLSEGVQKVGLLGTAFTMEEEFYKGRLKTKYKIDVVIPNKEDRKFVHDAIYRELCLGTFESATKAEYMRIIDSLAREGAEAVILGCTEIGLLVQQVDTTIRLLDTTAIHAAQAVQYALASRSNRDR